MKRLVKENMRPNKTEYYLDIAKATAQRSTCLRRKYGAVVVKDDIIVSTGYNGSPRGEANCSDIKSCYRLDNNIKHGEHYEFCKSVHAEANALLFAGYPNAKGAVLYLYGENADGSKIDNIEPCLLCRKLIANTDILKVVTPDGEIISRRRGSK